MNKTAKGFREWFARGKKSIQYYIQGAIIDFTELIFVRMTELSISKSELAGKLKCNPSYITKMLRGSTNFTLQSMVKIGLALDAELVIGLKPRKFEAKWVGFDFGKSTSITSPKQQWVWPARGNLTEHKMDFFPQSESKIQLNERNVPNTA